MKKQLLKLLALTSAVVIAFPLFASCSKDEEPQVKAVSHVSLDINPSLSFSLDEENKVISVHASNEDAQIMLYGEHLEGLTLDVALEKVAQLSLELDYLNVDNHGINVSVSGNIGEAEVVGKVEGAFDKESGSLDVNVSADGTFSDLRMLESIKANFSANVDVQNLTVNEYKLIAEAQAVDGTLSVEEAVKMKTEELIKIISDGAKEIEPYATKAYNAAVVVAERAYNELKGQLIDTMWLEPYVKDMASAALTGKRKYLINNGALYNMYAASSRVMGVAIDSIEKAIEIANNTQVPSETIDKIALALALTEEQKAAFVAEVTVDGKITLASIEAYLTRWLKNLTSEERAQIEATVQTLIRDVQAFAVTIDSAIAEEYKNALTKLATDLNNAIPSELKTLVGAYVTEFENLVNKVVTAVDSKEPLVAAKDVKVSFDEGAAAFMKLIRAELTEEDLASVENKIALVNDTLATYEKNFADAKAKAEADAKAWLESVKAARTQA